MANDYPDGFRRLLPGNTVDLTAGFARPWYMGTTLNIAAGSYSSYTIHINDPDSIYYVDVVNVSAQSSTDFGVRVYINSIPYTAETCTGFAYIPMRTNPSIFLISDDSIQVVVHNFDASARSYEVKVHGTKITRPDVFGHAPAARFTVHAHTIDVLTAALFSDASTFTPTAWEWDFRDGQAKSYVQMPWAVFKTPGSYYPLLKASNVYGYDTYAEQVPVVCNPVLYPPGWTEYDPGGYVTVDDTSVTVTALPSDIDTYVYMDLVGRLATSFRFKCKFECSLLAEGSYFCSIGYGNTLSSANNEAISHVGIFLTYAGGHSLMVLAHYGVTYEVSDIYSDFPIDGTPLYLDLHHSPGSDTVSLNIYSDAAMTILLRSLSITHSNLATITFRYCYLARSVSSTGAPAKTVKVSDITFQYE